MYCNVKKKAGKDIYWLIAKQKSESNSISNDFIAEMEMEQLLKKWCDNKESRMKLTIAVRQFMIIPHHPSVGGSVGWSVGQSLSQAGR